MPRRAVIGPQIVESVDRLTSETSMARSQAFKQVAADRGMSLAAVQANYYRTTRRRGRGSSGQPRAARPSRAARPTTRPTSQVADIDRLASELVSAVQSLAAAAVAQERELADLRKRLSGALAALG